MSPDKLIFYYVAVFLSGITIVAIFSEMRRRRFRPERSEDRVFRCEKCGFVYTDDADVERSRCSQCGILNDAVEF